jgi:hypothetical protein
MVAIIAPLAVVTVLLLIELVMSSAADARWKICGYNLSSCNTTCSRVIASFPTYEECAAALKKRALTSGNIGKAEKSAGAAGVAECKKRYGKNVTNATLSSDGKTLVCHATSTDPIEMRDACKKRYGPMAQFRWHRGKIYCAAP